MKAKSYPPVAASIKTLQILKYIGGKIEPVPAEKIVKEFDMNFSTVMTHLITLEQEKFIENTGGGYIVGMEAARVYAMRRAIGNKRQQELDAEKIALGI